MSKKESSPENSRKIKISRQSLRKAVKIFRFLKPYKAKFAAGMFFLIAGSLTSMLFPALMGKLVGSTLSAGVASDFFLDLNDTDTVALLLLGVFILQGTFSYFRILLFSDVTERMLASLRQHTYSHLIRLPMSFFSKRRVGELNSRISSDVGILQETFTTTIAEFLRQIITILVGTALLFFYSYKLTLLMLATLPLMMVTAVVFGKFIRRLSKDTQNKIAASNVIVEETLTGITNVKAFVNEFFESARYRSSTNDIRNIAMRAARWRGAFASFIIVCMFGVILLVIWYGVKLGMKSDNLFAFVLYSVFVGASFGGIADLFTQIQKAIGATENLMEILDEQTEDIPASPGLPQTALRGEVQFSHVTFAYPSRKDSVVLRDVSFTVPAGEQLAVVGPSGAGKSTLTNLLLRFYEPVSGEILIDGRSSASLPLHELRSNMALVPQEVLLFGGTILENIAYGKPGATHDEIIEAAKKANAHEFISQFPDKYETLVGERGIQLSGGQRQRIAIARAVLKDPAILILDEATSSLDSESERLVQDALEKLMRNRTSIVIAHRLSTVRNADKILVLEKGEVRESGTHAELMNMDKGLYQHLSRLQLHEVSYEGE